LTGWKPPYGSEKMVWRDYQLAMSRKIKEQKLDMEIQNYFTETRAFAMLQMPLCLIIHYVLERCHLPQYWSPSFGFLKLQTYDYRDTIGVTRKHLASS